jgi:AraC-like DNA-binding protein
MADKKGMQQVKKALPAIILLFLASVFSTCAQPGGDEYASINLSGKWKIIESPGDAPADPRFDDSAADEVEIPGSWDHVLEKNDDRASTIWLRKKISIGKEFSDRLLVLSLGTIALSDEAYFNGVYIGGTGTIPSTEWPLDYVFAFNRERTYQFSSSLVRPGRENVIAIKIFSHYINGIKDRPGLMGVTAWEKKNRYRDFIPSFNNLNSVVLSVFLLMLLALIMKGSGNKKIALYAFVFIMGVFIIDSLMLGMPRFRNNLYRFKLFFGIYAFVDYALLLLIQEFFNIKLKAMTALFTVLLAACSALIAYAPHTAFFVTYCVNAASALVIIYILCALTIFIIALYRDPRRFWYLSFVALFIIISVSNTLYTIIAGQMYRMSRSFALRLPAILLGALFVYLFDLKNIRKERDSLAQALIKKSKQLQKAAKTLSSVDIKPEPRDIIHDLIEYLDANFNETYDRIKLAERFGLNEDYMGQLFKKVTNTNIANYINMKRIEASKQLLRETDTKVIDIAFHVGFDNLTYFYRHFKKHTGFSPIEFRRMARKSLIDFDGAADEETY